MQAWLGVATAPWYDDFDFIEPIAADRGLPEGFSLIDNEWRCESGNFGDMVYIGESHRSWVLASEVLAAVPGIVTRPGRMLLENYDRWDGRSEPENVGSTGPSDEVGARIVLDEETTVVVVQWHSEIKELVTDFVERMGSLVEKYGPNVRYVYGFS
ncbi:hypothetical protein [Pandoraea apista]|uniref:hypothetical protein n=1 Tax=Pandoraea apista TaxID=93218 RepID=UPI0012E29C34|nr:hypothetical protein [Pandoraea apista]